MQAMQREVGLRLLVRVPSPLQDFNKMYPGLSLTLAGVTLPSNKMGKTPLDYIPCVSEAFKRINKASSYYRRIILIQNPRGTSAYKSKMEKRFGVTLKQG